MKWFKHSTDFLSSPAGDICQERFGAAGLLGVVKLWEIMADNFDIEKPGEFYGAFQAVRHRCFPRMKKATIKVLFDYCKDPGWITEWHLYPIGKETEIYIRCDRLKELADEYTQKALAGKLRKANNGED
jgi:hypothetical protein